MYGNWRQPRVASAIGTSRGLQLSASVNVNTLTYYNTDSVEEILNRLKARTVARWTETNCVNDRPTDQGSEV